MSGETTSDPTSIDDLEDGQGIHSAAGVPNRAAYLIGEELGRDAMADIYMDTIQNHLDEDMTIADLAGGTISSAESLYGEDSTEAAAVRQAWNDVGYTDEQIESGDAVVNNSQPDSGSGDSDHHGHEH
jgi:Zn-dependent metalloprotease